MLQAADDPNRKGIMVPLGQDRTKQLLQPRPGLPPSAVTCNGLQAIIWRPDTDFASCLPGGIPCPCCKVNCLARNDAVTRNLRKVMGRDRTILMIGCTYKCKACAGACSG